MGDDYGLNWTRFEDSVMLFWVLFEGILASASFLKQFSATLPLLV